MKSNEFVEILRHITTIPTLYVMGCWGSPLREKFAKRYLKNNTEYKQKIMQECFSSEETHWGFDCVCLVKTVLCGWCEDENDRFGGAVYKSVCPDETIEYFAKVCTDVSDDFTNIEEGEFVWLKGFGHCGIYVGNGEVVESTPKWNNCVQVSSFLQGNKFRQWYQHGKLPYIEYNNDIVDIDIPNEENELTYEIIDKNPIVRFINKWLKLK